MGLQGITVNLTLGQITDYRYILRILLHQRLMEVMEDNRFQVDTSNVTIISKIMEFQDIFRELESPFIRAQILLNQSSSKHGAVQFPLQMATDIHFVLSAHIPENYLQAEPDKIKEMYEVANKAREGLLLAFEVAMNNHDLSLSVTQFNNEAKA
jgi:hypothetical protein